MAAIETVQEIPHLGGVKPGLEPEHLLVPYLYDRADEVVERFDELCADCDHPTGLRLPQQVIEVVVVKHEELGGGLEYSTRSILALGPIGIKEALSIMTPKNGPEFGLVNDHYGGVHRNDGLPHDERPLSPERHWNRLFKGLLSRNVRVVRMPVLR